MLIRSQPRQVVMDLHGDQRSTTILLLFGELPRLLDDARRVPDGGGAEDQRHALVRRGGRGVHVVDGHAECPVTTHEMPFGELVQVLDESGIDMQLCNLVRDGLVPVATPVVLNPAEVLDSCANMKRR